MKRFIFDIVVFLSLFLFPWWITLPLAVVGLCVFRHFYEYLFVGSIMYALHASGTKTVFASPFWFAAILVVVYIVVDGLQQYVILYPIKNK